MTRTLLFSALLLAGTCFNGLAQNSQTHDGQTVTKTETAREAGARKQQSQIDGATLNDKIEAKKKEIREIEGHLKRNESDPNYNSAASKKRLQQAREELKELQKQTL